MGLDGVELLLAIEDEFQIAITDEEAFRSETPAKLTEIVYLKMRQSEHDVCPSQHGFYKVRKYMTDFLKIPRMTIKPDTPLKNLIQKKNRRKNWAAILSALSGGQTVFAPLERPKWLKLAIYLIIPVIAFPVLLRLTYYTVNLSVIMTGALIPLLMLLTTPMKYEFPDNFYSVKDLIRIIGTLQTKTWDKDELYKKIRKIIAQQLNIKEEDIHPDSHFIKDLGMG